ncbi:MAG: hypothetical protein GIW98_05240 [Candidatus Eremiobacteraeota bacterium]|nr:hypothetical protein [Candidatus Eremiobacteraeota bacterium]
MFRLSVARAILVAITLLVAVTYYAPFGNVDFFGNWGGGTLGFSTDRFSGIIQSVDASARAGEAGLRVGDRVIFPDSLAERSRLTFPRAGTLYTVRALSGGKERTVQLAGIAVAGFGRAEKIEGLLNAVLYAVFLGVAFLLVFLRPNVMTWAFYLYSVGYFATRPALAYFNQLPDTVFSILSLVLFTVFGSFSAFPLMAFVLRFPDNELTGWRRIANYFVNTVLLIAYALYIVEWIAYVHQRPVHNQFYYDNVFPLAALGCSALIVWLKYRKAPAALRQRYRWLAIGMVVSFAAYASYYIPVIPYRANQVITIAVVLMPIAVAYSVLRHRVLDVSFVLNRAIVYGIMTTILLAFIGLLDWVSSRLLAETHVATAVEATLTVGLGFILNRIHQTFEGLVERVLFRSRHSAEKYLRRVARALPYASAEDAIEDGLVHEPVSVLALSSGAFFKKMQNGNFNRSQSIGWDTDWNSVLDANENLVRFLQSEEDAVRLEDLREHASALGSGPRAPILAVPITVRHELVGFTLYGAHSNGTEVDPDELSLLKLLAIEASRAFDHLETLRLREALSEMQHRLVPQAPPLVPGAL